MTNLTTLTDERLIQQAVDYMKYLGMQHPFLNLSKTLCMYETAVYFEDARTQTVDLQGRQHVVIKSTGFASMRVTVIAAVWADGRKAPPMIIHKGSNTNNITRQNGILTCHQTKAWVNADLLIRLVVVSVLLPYFFI
jgi:nitrate reductase cytochrome c-type subunit